jgi:hypothetical protein
MAISYEKLRKKPLIFQRMSGVSIEEFQTICAKVKPLWETEVEAKKKQEGRHRRLRSIEDKVLALLIYYRTYITYEFVAIAKIEKLAKLKPRGTSWEDVKWQLATRD